MQIVLGVSVIGSIAAWGLGVWGFYDCNGSCAEGLPAQLSDAAYRALQLFHLEFDWPDPPASVPRRVHVARVLAPTFASLAIISAIWFFVRDRIGGIRTYWQRDHIVLCGAGDKGVRMVRCLARGEDDGVGKRRVVVVDLASQDSPNLVACRAAGAITLTGDARDPSMLQKARVGRARYLVLTCGNDGTNAEIAIQARDLVHADRVKALRCFAHLTDPALCRLLREREFEMGLGGNFRLEFFNVYSSGALTLLQEHPPFGSATATAAGPEPRNVMVVGLDALGQCVVSALTRSWARQGGQPKALRLTLYDRGVHEKAASLRLADPTIDVCVDLGLHELDRTLPSFDGLVLEGDDRAPPVGIAYICLHDDGESLTAALALLRTARSHRMRIVVTMMEDSGLATLLRDGRGEFQDLRGFSVLDHSCTADVLRGRNEEIARAVHEHYQQTAHAGDASAGVEPSLMPWTALPESLKRSNRRQADHIFAKLDAIGCALAPYDPGVPEPFSFEPSEVEKLARMEHDRWAEEREEDGWVIGSRKDVERKITPYLAPWKELDEEIRELDRNAVRHLPDLVAMADLMIVRQRPAGVRDVEPERRRAGRDS